MIGSIIGDIVGSVYEFTPNNIKSKEFVPTKFKEVINEFENKYNK